ncbi:hypothetical protein [Streptomyces chiangmaiensis]|uniref:Transposase n=1 Tax=Streptomyces chiangmaiensis TaxID=766497 RepID=A0ABU7FLF5_9ACTN|nr:hypothetical protein [Streptomyces chiangmaiensis]MED7824942.1 hypothetical protein [Streptomyces chiangmaiensis]
MRLRSIRETPGLDDLEHFGRLGCVPLHDKEPWHPERVIERHALRVWIWDAVENFLPDTAWS